MEHKVALKELENLYIERKALTQKKRHNASQISILSKRLQPNQKERNDTKLKYVLNIYKPLQIPTRERRLNIQVGNVVQTEIEFLKDAALLPIAYRLARYVNYYHHSAPCVWKDARLLGRVWYGTSMGVDIETYSELNLQEVRLRILCSGYNDYVERLVQAFRQNWAAKKIQYFVRNTWFWKPVYKSGRYGYECRKGWEMIKSCNAVCDVVGPNSNGMEDHLN